MMYALSNTTKIKTNRQLGLHQSYWEGLWEVLRRLERGEFEYRGGGEYTLRKDVLGFSMAEFFIPAFSTCGAVGCMSGWASFFASGTCKRDFREHLDNASASQRIQHRMLVAPYGYDETPEDFPPERCAPVLRRYLETGEVHW